MDSHFHQQQEPGPQAGPARPVSPCPGHAATRPWSASCCHGRTATQLCYPTRLPRRPAGSCQTELALTQHSLSKATGATSHLPDSGGASLSPLTVSQRPLHWV